MKKHRHLKKALSLVCILIIVTSMASVSVSARLVNAIPILELFQPFEDSPQYYEIIEIGRENHTKGLVINGSDYEMFLQPCANAEYSSGIRDITLELAGFKRLNENDFDNFSREEEFQQALKDAFNPHIGNQDSINIPAFPMNGTAEEQAAWVEEYGDNIILINYVFHRHKLQGSQMYFDDNYHWQLCTECGNRAYLANHTDKDNDGKCDFCGSAIRYYNVTVKDTTGGKVTLSANKGAIIPEHFFQHYNRTINYHTMCNYNT